MRPTDAGRGLLLEHANVITLDPNRPRAQAVLCRGGRIQAVGTNEELEDLLRDGDARFDCGELTLVPGFVDSHVHFLSMGLGELRVDLADLASRDALLDALRLRALETVEGEWVLGVDFDESRWSGDRALPTREELDARVSDRNPVVARRVCGHIAVANSRAVELLEGRWEEVQADTGLLLEEVVLRLSEAVGVSDEEARRAVSLATVRAHEEGVTTVVDMTDLRTLRTLRELDEAGRLGVRVLAAVQARDLPDLGEEDLALATRGGGAGNLRLVGVKAFVDGSLGARTAALSEPYADDPEDPGNRGMLLATREELVELARRVEGLGLQLFIHAIGDRAIDLVLDAIEEGCGAGNPRRHRIEHMETARPDQLERMKALRVVASMQPNFIVQWSGPGGLNEQRLGVQRARGAEALRDVWAMGIPLALGSDCMPFGPLFGLEGAVHHPLEEQSLPPVVALRAYTSGSAWSVHAEDELGSVEVGKAADLVLLDEDPEVATDLRSVNVVATVQGGRLVHTNGAAFNEAVNRAAQRALEESFMEAELPRLDLEGPREDDDHE